MTCLDLEAEAAVGVCLTRLERLCAAGVLTGVQAGRIAKEIAAQRGAVLGGLKAQNLVDLSAAQSDV